MESNVSYTLSHFENERDVKMRLYIRASVETASFVTVVDRALLCPLPLASPSLSCQI